MSKVHKTLMRHSVLKKIHTVRQDTQRILVQTYSNPLVYLVDIVFLFLHVDVSSIEGFLEPEPIVPKRVILAPCCF